MAVAVSSFLQWLKSEVADRQLDAILIGLGGALTFLGSSIYSVAVSVHNWHPLSFGEGFAAMVTGLGILFRLRQRGANDDS